MVLFGRGRFAVLTAFVIIQTLAGCSVGGSGNDAQVFRVTFDPVLDDPNDPNERRSDALTSSEIDRLVEAAARKFDLSDSARFPDGPPRVSIAVTDRIGNILRVWSSDPAAQLSDFDCKIATSLARTAAYMSHSQAPLTSRTMQFLHSYHFPPVFEERETFPFSRRFEDVVVGFPTGACDGNAIDPDRFSDRTATDFIDVDDLYAPVRKTRGVLNTSQGPLWEINTTNRGGLNEAYDAGMEIPRLLNPDGSLPNPGFTPLPGGVPLFKRTLASGSIINRRLVGAIGVYMMRNQPGVPFSQRDPLPEEAEIAAFSASRIGNPFRLSASNPTCNLNQQDDYTINGTIPVQSEGGVFLVGILLAYLGDRTAPINTACALSPTDPGVFPGDYDPALTLSDGGRGRPDPSPWLISPRDSFDMAGGGLSRQEVETIILQCVRASERTHAAIRLPAFSPCQMIIAVSDFDGTMLGVYREPDATLFSLEVSVSKARNAYYYSNPNSRDVGGPNNGMHPLASVFPNENASGVLTGPVNGIAVTARSFGFLTQPSFPPTIDGSSPGPLRCLIDRNATAQAFDKMGFAPPDLRIDSTKNPGEPGRIIRLLYPPGQSRIEQPITDPNRLAFYRDVMGEPPPTNQSGIVFFPGSAPLYRNGQLVGGIGVSGDGVEQDDIVTAQGIIEAAKILGFEIQPPPSKRCDRYNVQGVRVPYWKFPQNPRG